MTAATIASPPPGSEARPRATAQRRRPAPRWWQPPWWRAGWPLATFCLGLPLWWLVGTTGTILIALAVPMAWQLRRRHRRGLPVLAPGGFGLWVLFLAMIAISSLTLFADAPGAVPGGGLGRVASWLIFTGYYLAATVALLWVANSDPVRLPAITVVRLIGFLYVVSAVGGWLGMLWPQLRLTSLIELALPGALADQAMVRELTHPVTAQVQDFLGYSSARPAAPYPFTNAWGANTVVYLPFFVVGWLRPGSGRLRPIGLLVLAASAVPIVYSLNRGMWIGLLAMAVLATGLLASRGHYTALVAVFAAVAALAVAVVATPLGDKVTERLANPHSNTRRADLAGSTLSAALASPVVGFGSTRPVQGTFTSVTQADTAECPKCEVPPFGTHGHLYRLVFTTGYLGAGLYFGFLVRRLIKHARSRDPVVLACWMAAAVSLLFTLYYNLLPHALYVVLTGLGLAWRCERAQ